VDQLVVEPQLRVGQDHRQLGPGQPLAEAPALGDLLVGGQGLDAPVEARAALKGADHVGVLEQHLGRRRFGDRQGLALHVVAAKHEVCDLAGHLREQAVARLAPEPARPHRAAQQDLDVDLDVGAVDAARVVDEVGVERPPAARTRSVRAA
jgi:hypothetical protein